MLKLYTNNKKWFTSLVAGIILTIAGCNTLPTFAATGDIPPQIIAWAESNVVKVHAGRHIGSGFFISPTKIVTNCHVVAPWAGVYISKEGSDTLYRANVEVCNKEEDMALLELHDEIPDSLPTYIARDNPRTGQATYSTGYPTALPLIVTQGNWQRQNNLPENFKDSYIDTGHAINGNSGSPVLILQNGKVVVISVKEAVLNIGGQQFEDLTFVINPEKFRAFYDEYH